MRTAIVQQNGPNNVWQIIFRASWSISQRLYSRLNTLDSRFCGLLPKDLLRKQNRLDDAKREEISKAAKKVGDGEHILTCMRTVMFLLKELETWTENLTPLLWSPCPEGCAACLHLTQQQTHCTPVRFPSCSCSCKHIVKGADKSSQHLVDQGRPHVASWPVKLLNHPIKFLLLGSA